MKRLSNYIFEEFRINKNTNIIKCKYFPESNKELKEIVQERLKKDPNANLNDIDVSKIVDMSRLFQDLDPHNINISRWDVSNVTNMRSLFAFCTNLQCDISDWDMSNVENAAYMFYDCRKFNCDLSEWDVKNVTNMEGMFNNCSILDFDISNWDVSNVTNMKHMFGYCKEFKGIGLDKWKLNKSINRANIEHIFVQCSKINYPLWYKEIYK